MIVDELNRMPNFRRGTLPSQGTGPTRDAMRRVYIVRLGRNHRRPCMPASEPQVPKSTAKKAWSLRSIPSLYFRCFSTRTSQMKGKSAYEYYCCLFRGGCYPVSFCGLPPTMWIILVRTSPVRFHRGRLCARSVGPFDPPKQ